jgi:hypothetical protein
VVGVDRAGPLKAAVVGVLGERQRRDQADQLLPYKFLQQVGGRGARPCQDTQAHHPPPPHFSYRKVSFVIADSNTGIVPTMLFFPRILCHAQPRRPMPARPPRKRAREQGAVWRVSVWRE